MARNRPLYFIISFLFYSISLFAQPTVLAPGDVIVLGVNTDTGPCGLHPESDEISFTLMKNLTPFSRFQITDNGWEVANPGFWGDKEGVLDFLRTGPMIPRGTVITLVCTNNGGVFSYDVVSPDNGFFITNADPIGGQFDMESGGDQIYFLQNGTWNGSGGNDMATYSGDVLYGFTTTSSWTADGTTHNSNLHPDVDPCFQASSFGSEYYKYTGDFSPTNQFDWWYRNKDNTLWTAFPDCNSYVAGFPNYPGGFTIGIEDLDLGVSCHGCNGCPPYDAFFELELPPGYFFNIEYTDETDTFLINNAQDGDFVNIIVTDTITYSLVSVTDAGGCPMNFPFTSEATFNAPHNNPGTHGTLWICPDYGTINLGIFLGPHDPGGQWFPPLDPITGMYYSSFWGPGVYHYVFVHPPCPIDSASVSVHWVDTAGTHVEIGCDVNGTPTDITDDRMVVTVYFTVNSPDFGLQYEAIPEHFNQPYGTIEPSSTGDVGEIETFILAPGTATLTNMSLEIQGYIPIVCDWRIPLPPPGFCSDPCDHEMTATITGGGDICPNSCPDSPLEIVIDHDGGEEDFTAEISISTPGFPTWTISDIELEGFAPTTITVCVGDVPQPVYDAGSLMLTLPKVLAGHDISIKLNHVLAKYDCVALLDNDEVIVTIHALPPITTTSFKVCKGVSTTVDLTEYDHFISNAYDVHWFDEDPLQGGNEIFSPNVTNLQNVVQLWAYVEDDYCGNSIQVPFVILPQPDLDSVPPIQVCNGNPVTFANIVLNDMGNSMATYTFHDSLPPDTSNKFNTPFFIPLDTTTIYVLATALICYDTLAIEVDVQQYPDFLLQGLPCDLNLNTYSILFTSSADSIHASKGIVVNNGLGQDTIKGIPADSAVIIEILNPSGLCKDTFLITAPNCNCPFIAQPIAAQPTYSICEGLPNPILSVTVDPGLQVNWYDVQVGGVPLLQNSTTFQPVLAASATYYAEAIDPNNLCYSIRTDIPVSVNPVAQLQPLADEVLCETETLNFNTLIPVVTNGVPGSGQWYNISNNQQVSGTIQPNDGDSWYYLFTSNPGLCESRDTIQATVNELPFVNVFDIVCDDASLTFDVLFTSNADVILTNTGTLVNTSATDSFSLNDIPFDTDVNFDLEILATGCTATYSQVAPNCSCPNLLDQTTLRACDDQGNIDLSAFVGPGVNGSWQMVSTPAGGNPATLNGSTFQGVGKDDGLYTLRFIRDVILNNCVDTAFFQLTLNESPFADAGVNATVCAPDQIILSGNAGGTGVTFSWQENGTGSIANPNALNTTYTPTLADITAGSVNFTLIATDPTGFCPNASETITVDIDGSAYFIINPTSATYCDTADIDVDFDALVSYGTTGGYWFFPVGVNAPITNSSHFNPTTLAAGNYTVYYTTNNATPPCKNDTVGVALTIRNCQCPSVALSTPVDALCSESDLQDLDDFLMTTEAGTWSIVSAPAGSKPAVINGANFTTNNSDAGVYTIRFTLSNPIAGCPDHADISLTVIATPTIQIASIECADDLLSWEAVVISTAQSVTSSLGTVTSLGSNLYLIDGITLLTNLQVSASNGNGLCSASASLTAPDCDCAISISNLPASVSLCPDDKITFQPDVTGGKGSVSSFWIVAGDSLYQNALEVGQGGTYEFVSIDSLGCKDQQAIDVTVYTEMSPDVSLADVKCPGDHDGEILLNDILGGNGPYFISLNGGNSQPIAAFPYTISNLNAGNYTIVLTDAFSCIYTFQVTIGSASSETLSLGPDQTILVGDSAVIKPTLSFVPDSFFWTGDIDLLDLTQLNNTIHPDQDQTISLFSIDAKGCLYSDDIFIRVLLKSSIYVPTIFSPNDDGINDILGPQADPSVVSFDYFEVFSRWGELVYSEHQFLPSDNKGWDGTFNGKPMQPGVFIYRYSATNKKGKTIVGYGDVTIVR